ncbi:hypothetical protein Dfri01_01930 [Dyadobacter frigoris]|uniref:protein-export chaperone SecB n=1 Tax=Dyadobacter frigoris TaxID=2576211 RepID=UPI0024A466DA|nr:protein-export chaperone SecB [Dyadobacter frigoris]GLU50732.1 hypothetical protein Dfri01_01930 [Dyadobacter frigoris]
MNKASFSLEEYKFEKVIMDFSNGSPGEINLSFDPSGQFSHKDQTFNLHFKFSGSDNSGKAVVIVECTGIFKFEGQIEFEEIPSYFYKNSIAILFPFVRSFVSTVTLQANIQPLLLPTMNLSSLEAPLKDNTIQI